MQFVSFAHGSRDDSQVLANKCTQEWLVACLSQGMFSRPLVSADDKSRSGFERKLAPQASHYVGALKSLTEAQDLLRRFNPRLVGFGIADPSPSHFFDSGELTDTRSRDEITDKSQEAK
jgi:hypothetical protein